MLRIEYFPGPRKQALQKPFAFNFSHLLEMSEPSLMDTLDLQVTELRSV